LEAKLKTWALLPCLHAQRSFFFLFERDRLSRTISHGTLAASVGLLMSFADADIDLPKVVPTKQPVAKPEPRVHVKPAEKPETIERNLRDPVKRKYIGACCVTFDGTIRGTRTWGDATCKTAVVTKQWYKGHPIYECMGCRKPLVHRTEDERAEDEMWADAEQIVTEQKEKKRQRLV